MKAPKLARWIALAAIPAWVVWQAAAADALRSLVEAERGFAAMAVEQGTHKAFYENLAEDSVLFRPTPVNGKQWFRDHPPKPGLLTWGPSFAFVSAAGDLGCTTGPWEFRKLGKDDPPIAFGHFVSVWRKQRDGRWMVEVDLGISHPQLEQPPARWEPPKQGKAKAGKVAAVDAEAGRAEVLKAEQELGRLVSAQGVVRAYEASLRDDARYYRDDVYPIVGKEAVLKDLGASGGLSSWTPDRAGVARSGDLGYTYGLGERRGEPGKVEGRGEPGKVEGRGEPGKVERFIYTRIWRKDAESGWKVALEVINALPPGTGPTAPAAPAAPAPAATPAAPAPAKPSP